jgi:hypothetical protein
MHFLPFPFAVDESAALEEVIWGVPRFPAVFLAIIAISGRRAEVA